MTIVTIKSDLTLLLKTLCLVTLISIASCFDCKPPRAIKDATYEYTGLRLPDGDFKNGAVVTYTCNEGFTKGKDSNGMHTCSNGDWTGDADNFRCCKLQICIDPNLFCVLPQVNDATVDIVAGNSSFSIEKGGKMAYGIGTIVKFNCHGDHKLASGSTNGPFECMHGGQWSSSNFTECQIKDCGPPPKIANGRAQNFYSWETGTSVGIKYKYVCDHGYETVPFLDTVVCDSDLNWKITLGFGTVNIDLPQCTKKSPPTTETSYTDYNFNKKPNREWTSLKVMVIGSFVLIVSLIILFACRRNLTCWRHDNGTRTVVMNGVTTTEYVGPTNYVGPPPTLTTGPVIFAPPSAPFPPQGGTYTPESYPLTSKQ